MLSRTAISCFLLLCVALPAGADIDQLATPPEGIDLCYPDPLTIEAPVEGDWSNAAWLSITVLIKAAEAIQRPPAVRMLVYLQNRDGWWYQSSQTYDLKPNIRRTVQVDMRPTSADWVPRGQFRPWDDYVLWNLRAIGIKVFCDGQLAGKLIVQSPKLSRLRDGSHGSGQPAVVDFDAPAAVTHGELYEAKFRLSRTFPNPFDARAVDIRGEFVAPDKQTVIAPDDIEEQTFVGVGDLCGERGGVPEVESRLRQFHVEARDFVHDPEFDGLIGLHPDHEFVRREATGKSLEQTFRHAAKTEPDFCQAFIQTLARP